jgi:hypothetical protein
MQLSAAIVSAVQRQTADAVGIKGKVPENRRNLQGIDKFDGFCVGWEVLLEVENVAGDGRWPVVAHKEPSRGFAEIRDDFCFFHGVSFLSDVLSSNLPRFSRCPAAKKKIFLFRKYESAPEVIRGAVLYFAAVQAARNGSISVSCRSQSSRTQSAPPQPRPQGQVTPRQTTAPPTSTISTLQRSPAPHVGSLLEKSPKRRRKPFFKTIILPPVSVRRLFRPLLFTVLTLPLFCVCPARRKIFFAAVQGFSGCSGDFRAGCSGAGTSGEFSGGCSERARSGCSGFFAAGGRLPRSRQARTYSTSAAFTVWPDASQIARKRSPVAVSTLAASVIRLTAAHAFCVRRAASVRLLFGFFAIDILKCILAFVRFTLFILPAQAGLYHRQNEQK